MVAQNNSRLVVLFDIEPGLLLFPSSLITTISLVAYMCMKLSHDTYTKHGTSIATFGIMLLLILNVIVWSKTISLLEIVAETFSISLSNSPPTYIPISISTLQISLL